MIGHVVLSQYEIVDILGQGGMSVVYKGRHRLTEQEVALKILPPELAAMSQVKSRFVEEAKALAQLDHPNIVHLYNFGEENGCFVLAMQYVHGDTFERLILDAGELDWGLSSRITIDVLRALEYAHGRGIIHRDMKPSNILVRELDGSATVMDFGIAKMTNSTRLTATGQTMGTVRYMSPEQVRGLQVDARTDIYSLGATLYEAVCGDTPFDGDTHFEIMTKHLHEPPPLPSADGIELPSAFEAMLMRSLAKDPDDRFQNAREFRKELEGILRQHDIGWAETMRLTRDSVALSGQRKKGRASTPPATPDAGETRESRETKDEKEAVEPAQSEQRRTAALGPVPDDADASAFPLDDVGSAPSERLPRELTQNVARGGRPGPWIAMAGAVVLVAAAVVFYVTRTSSSGSDKPAGGNAAKHTPDAAPRWPEPFRPPGVDLAVDKRFADAELRVLAIEGWDPERILRARNEGHAFFSDLLAESKLAKEVPVQPLSIVVIPQPVFCDSEIYEHGKVLPQCGKREALYRPRERTLLVANNLERLDVNVAYGNAISVCLHSQIPGCDGTAAKIDGEFEKRRKTRKGRRK